MMNQSVTRPFKSAPHLGLPRVLIIGCDDAGQRRLALFHTRFRIFAVTSCLEDRTALREADAVPIVANLDDAVSLRRLRRLSPRVPHLALPPTVGDDDPRTATLLCTPTQPPPGSTAAKHHILPEQACRTDGLTGRLKTPLQTHAFVYASTSGVYGDADGAWIDKSRPVKPHTARTQCRVAAERRVRWFDAGGVWRTSILHIPGIYTADWLPIAQLEYGTPALHAQDDVYTNHIHADDLVRTVITALFRGRPQCIMHATDASELCMGDYLDAVADARDLQRPPRISRAETLQQIEPALLSFVSESRQLRDTRLAHELRAALRYPTVVNFLSSEA